jgi:hypothetical protein
VKVVDDHAAHDQADAAADAEGGADHADARGHALGGNSSRVIPKASGKTAAAVPCTARPAISISIECDIAQTTDPAAKTTSELTSIRSLPNMSPSRPTIGVETDAGAGTP